MDAKLSVKHSARLDTLIGGLRSYFSQPGAAAFLGFIVLYKLGDAFAGSLLTPFLLQGMADRFHLLPYGLALVLVMLLRPQGIWPARHQGAKA